MPSKDQNNFILELSIDHAQVTPQILYKLYDAQGRIHRNKGGQEIGAFTFEPGSQLEIQICQLENGEPAKNPDVVENLLLVFAANLVSQKGPGPVNPDPTKFSGQQINLKPAGSKEKQIVKMEPMPFEVAGAWQVSGTLSLAKKGLCDFTFDPEVIVGRRE